MGNVFFILALVFGILFISLKSIPWIFLAVAFLLAGIMQRNKKSK